MSQQAYDTELLIFLSIASMYLVGYVFLLFDEQAERLPTVYVDAETQTDEPEPDACSESSGLSDTEPEQEPEQEEDTDNNSNSFIDLREEHHHEFGCFNKYRRLFDVI
jgi:hypothetical protein